MHKLVIPLSSFVKPKIIVYFLFKLPDSLPGRGGKIDDDIPKRKNLNEQPSTSNDEEKEEKPVSTPIGYTYLDDCIMASYTISATVTSLFSISVVKANNICFPSLKPVFSK